MRAEQSAALVGMTNNALRAAYSVARIADLEWVAFDKIEHGAQGVRHAWVSGKRVSVAAIYLSAGKVPFYRISENVGFVRTVANAFVAVDVSGDKKGNG